MATWRGMSWSKAPTAMGGRDVKSMLKQVMSNPLYRGWPVGGIGSCQLMLVVACSII